MIITIEKLSILEQINRKIKVSNTFLGRTVISPARFYWNTDWMNSCNLHKCVITNDLWFSPYFHFHDLFLCIPRYDWLDGPCMHLLRLALRSLPCDPDLTSKHKVRKLRWETSNDHLKHISFIKQWLILSVWYIGCKL